MPKPSGPLSQAALPLTAVVLILATGAVQDAIAPERGADTGPGGATLQP